MDLYTFLIIIFCLVSFDIYMHLVRIKRTPSSEKSDSCDIDELKDITCRLTIGLANVCKELEADMEDAVQPELRVYNSIRVKIQELLHGTHFDSSDEVRLLRDQLRVERNENERIVDDQLRAIADWNTKNDEVKELKEKLKEAGGLAAHFSDVNFLDNNSLNTAVQEHFTKLNAIVNSVIGDKNNEG